MHKIQTKLKSTRILHMLHLISSTHNSTASVRPPQKRIKSIYLVKPFRNIVLQLHFRMASFMHGSIISMYAHSMTSACNLQFIECKMQLHIRRTERQRVNASQLCNTHKTKTKRERKHVEQFRLNCHGDTKISTSFEIFSQTVFRMEIGRFFYATTQSIVGNEWYGNQRE